MLGTTTGSTPQPPPDPPRTVVACSPGGATPPPRGAARGSPHLSSMRCEPAVPARPGPARRSDIAVVAPRPTILPDGHSPAMPQVTAVDDQFGTHTSSTRPALSANATVRSRVGPRFLVTDLSRPASI